MCESGIKQAKNEGMKLPISITGAKERKVSNSAFALNIKNLHLASTFNRKLLEVLKDEHMSKFRYVTKKKVGRA